MFSVVGSENGSGGVGRCLNSFLEVLRFIATEFRIIWSHGVPTLVIFEHFPEFPDSCLITFLSLLFLSGGFGAERVSIACEAKMMSEWRAPGSFVGVRGGLGKSWKPSELARVSLGGTGDGFI